MIASVVGNQDTFAGGAVLNVPYIPYFFLYYPDRRRTVARLKGGRYV